MAEFWRFVLGFLQCAVSVAPYKPGQGRTARRATMFAVMAVVAVSAYQLFGSLQAVQGLGSQESRALIVSAILGVGCWLAYRVVHFPPFANFLGSVEAEMVKVSWPSSSELYTSTIVVLSVFFLLALLIFCFDMVWLSIFKAVNVM